MLNYTYARQNRHDLSKAQQTLWHNLRNRRFDGLKFRREHPIGPYIVDFICLKIKLVIEVDGGQHALTRDYDNRRTHWLEQQGFKVLRFWNNEVLVNTEVVLGEILKKCREE